MPRPAKGNLTLSVQQLMGCPTFGKTYSVGNPAAPNDMMPGDRLIDGENGATIKCSVNGSGPFTFSASIQGRSTLNERVTMTIADGVINADKLNGTATVSVNTPELNNTHFSPPSSCPVTVIGSEVKPGSMWAKVTCPKISEPSAATSCTVGTTTTFVIENCEGT
ncbi:MAG TPA: hypothetical protein VJV79_00825 [Polyangiaceae bacterium]|nr:hypothetical protein [Polyangiaceae bacterium]